MLHGFYIELSNISKKRIDRFARDLKFSLSKSGIKSDFVEGNYGPGERGDAITLGTLALAFISSNALVAFVDCLKVYIEREENLNIKITTTDGKTLEINSKNIDSELIRDAMRDCTKQSSGD